MSTPWTTRVWHEFHARNLTPAYRDVLLTLHSYRGTGGVAWPAHATLADRARCCTKTVQRALQHAERLGLIAWRERRRRAGWRWLRTSNLYRFLAPIAPVQPGWRPVFWRRATTGQVGGAEGRVSKKAALQDMLDAAAGLPDLLARRRAAFEARV